MVMLLWGKLTSLPRHQLVASVLTLILTTLVYVFLAEWVSDIWCGRNCRMLGPFTIIDLGFFCILVLTVLFLTAWVRNADRSNARDYVDQNVASLADRVESEGNELRQITTGHKNRINDLEDWVSNLRQALEEELGVKLPGRKVSDRAGSISLEASISTVEVNVRGSPYIFVRLRSWVRRRALRLWVLSRKCFWNWDDDQTNRRR